MHTAWKQTLHALIFGGLENILSLLYHEHVTTLKQTRGEKQTCSREYACSQVTFSRHLSSFVAAILEDATWSF